LYAHEVVLNELAQGLRPAPEGVEWFEGLAEEDQRKVLHALVLFCGQARACEDDVPESIARSGIRPTHTPAVMLTKWRFGMEALPAYELTKSFRLLIAQFSSRILAGACCIVPTGAATSGTTCRICGRRQSRFLLALGLSGDHGELDFCWSERCP
jgi:hypothetical protein